MDPLILLVDDEEDILDFLERVLQPKYGVLRAENGEEALTILDNEPVQLVISDIMMPVMDGFQFCKIIKSDIKYSHIPVILLTAKNTIQAKVEGLELGADAYIDKPFSKEHLIAQMQSLIANRNMIKEYFASSPLVHIKNMAHNKADEKFLENLHEIITKNIEDPCLDVKKLATLINMTRVTFYRKIKAISDLTPNELINVVRLKRAAQLLAEGEHKIYEIAYMVGYSSQSNFARDFLKQFNMTPSEYISSKQN